MYYFDNKIYYNFIYRFNMFSNRLSIDFIGVKQRYKILFCHEMEANFLDFFKFVNCLVDEKYGCSLKVRIWRL